MLHRCSTYVLLLSIMAFNTARAQERHCCTPASVTTPPTIDGRLTDAGWSKAETLTGFTIRGESQPAEPQTEVKMLFDDRALYIAIRFLESETNSLSKSYKERDDELWRRDDCIQVYIDCSFVPESSSCGALYYRFALSAGDVQFDAKDGARGWDGQWQSATALGDGEWTAELAIPWSNFGFSKVPEGVWRIQFYRHRTAGSKQFSNWSPGNGSWYDGAQFGYMGLPNPAGPLKAAINRVRAQLPAAAAGIDELGDSLLPTLTSLREKLSALKSLVDKAAVSVSEKQQDIKKLHAAQGAVYEALRELEGLRGAIAIHKQLATKGKLPPCLLAPVDSMTKIHRQLDRNCPSLMDDSTEKPLRLDGARGEYVHGQVVVIPTRYELKGVMWSAPLLRGPKGSEIPLSVRVVGYLRTEQPPYTVDFVGWWPDPLLDYLKAFDVPLRVCQPLWITACVPRDAEPGLYDGVVRVRSGDLEQALPVELRVRRFAIPRTRHLRVAPGYQAAKLTKLYDQDVWTDTFKWMYRRFLLEHRLNVTSIYAAHAPLLEESVEDLRRLREGGQDVFVICPLYSVELVGRADKIRELLARCREADIPDDALFFYGFDEAKEDARPGLVQTARIAKELFPQVTTMTTAIFKDLGANDDLGRTIDAWCPSLPDFVGWEKPRQAARARGKQVWWYTCCWPAHPYPNFFVEYPAIESRLLMGVMSWKYQPDGFLYYGLNMGSGGNTKGTRGDTPLCDWDPRSFKDINGDGCLFYPGVDGPISTIRLENFTDGLEDYECFWVLRDLTERLAKSDLGRSEEARAALAEARKRLTVPESTVKSLTEYSRNPRDLQLMRAQVADAIENILALGIEQTQEVTLR